MVCVKGVADGGFGDCDVFPGCRCTPEAPCEAGPATSCYALLDWRSPALVISLSPHVLQVQACLEPKGYLLFLLKECWLFNLSCCAALSLSPSLSLTLSIVIGLHKLTHIHRLSGGRKTNRGSTTVRRNSRR